jgi:hypothetical protein
VAIAPAALIVTKREEAMSSSNPSAVNASQDHAPDTQQLVALLGNLLPLLLRLQPQAPGPSFGPTIGPFSRPMGLSGPAGIGDPALDHQAAVNLIEDITADSLRTLSTYLESNARNFAVLESCVPIVTQAAQCFAARDYQQAFNQVWQAYRLITMIRAFTPQLPPLRAGAPIGASAPATGTAVH